MILLATLIATIQLSDSYLRYLAFSSQTSKKESRHFLCGSCIISVFLVLIYLLIFDLYGITAATYKAILIIFWIPHFILIMKVIPRPNTQHIFAMGMVGIWELIQNNWAAIIDTLFFPNLPVEEFLLLHSKLYLIFFILILPVERKIFSKILPETQLLESRPLGLYIAALPMVMMFGPLVLWADNQLIHSWTERLSRLYLLFAFILIHKYVSLGSKLFYENQNIFRNVRLIEEQVASLNYHNNLMQDSAAQMDNLRQNLREDYSKIYTMILNDKIDDAKEYIRQQTELLHATNIISFCRAPLINASLSIYFEQAKLYDIKLTHEINLVEMESEQEKDLAILISNLLENAITASKHQPQGKRSISIKINNYGERSMLEVSNSFNEILNIGVDGLPENQGVGMTSLKAFVKKYNTHMEFLQVKNYIHVLIYRED